MSLIDAGRDEPGRDVVFARVRAQARLEPADEAHVVAALRRIPQTAETIQEDNDRRNP